MPIIEYSSNNSGGNWWLTDEDWEHLERHGWEIRWIRNLPEEHIARRMSPDGIRSLGALATEARKEFPSLTDAVEEWEHITGKSAYASGCSCCGEPHHFYEVD